MKLPAGFRFAGTACGIKPHRPDLALVVSDADAACAGAFTVNRAKAAPVVDAERRLPAELPSRSGLALCAPLNAP